MITHTVSFKFKDELTLADREQFFQAAMKLGEIPGVSNLRLLKQTSSKNPFAFCLTMEFCDKDQYEFYSNHLLHNQFVSEQWLEKIASFQEADFEEVNEDVF